MKLDFSQCKTCEDVEAVLVANRDELDALRRVVNNLIPQAAEIAALANPVRAAPAGEEGNV